MLNTDIWLASRFSQPTGACPDCISDCNRSIVLIDWCAPLASELSVICNTPTLTVGDNIKTDLCPKNIQLSHRSFCLVSILMISAANELFSCAMILPLRTYFFQD